MKEFKPPISERTTTGLLKILGDEENYDPEAVIQAKAELNKRNVSQQKIDDIIVLKQQADETEVQKKANESYTLAGLLLSPGIVLIEILFSWELKKEGYLKKYKQQQVVRLILFLVIAISVLVSGYYK